jgi:hypothetical protein
MIIKNIQGRAFPFDDSEVIPLDIKEYWGQFSNNIRDRDGLFMSRESI